MAGIRTWQGNYFLLYFERGRTTKPGSIMKKYRIIIVENDEDEQFFMKEGFDAVGLFEIEGQLRSGDELFDWLSEREDNLPDIILTDLNMPGKNGYDIIESVQANPTYSH